MGRGVGGRGGLVWFPTRLGRIPTFEMFCLLPISLVILRGLDVLGSMLPFVCILNHLIHNS